MCVFKESVLIFEFSSVLTSFSCPSSYFGLWAFVTHTYAPISGKIQEFTLEGDSLWVKIEVPVHLMQYIVPKGFIAVDGASLTVCDVDDKENWFNLMLVVHTQKHITLPHKSIGSNVNLEVDVLGKYTERAMQSITSRLSEMEDRLTNVAQELANRISRLEERVFSS